MNKNLPMVTIVGQANVGKSSLFNRLVKSRQAIVAKEAGTTRNSVASRLQLPTKSCWLVDTAGLKMPEDDFEATIQEQINESIDYAQLIILVVDGTLHITQEDKKIAKKALKSQKPVILVVSKADLKSTVEPSEFLQLGIPIIVRTSSNHNQGIAELKNQLDQLLPHVTEKIATDVLKVALVGRPNVGKSFLFNKLAGKQQAIVADVAGTTRDLNRFVVNYHKQAIEFIDTAGIRRAGKQQVGIEKFSVLRTIQAIEESDVCLLLIDGTEYSTQLDQKLAGMIDEAGRGLVIVITKSDLLVGDGIKNRISNKITKEFQFVNYAPLIFTSSVTDTNISKLFKLIMQITEAKKQIIPTTKLNRILAEAKAQHQPAGLKNTLPKLRYIVQTDNNPPWFVVYGSNLKLLHWSYKRYLNNKIREHYDFTGVPIKFSFRESAKKNK